MVFLIQHEAIQDLVKKYNENQLSHVFLIETNDKVAALQDIKELIKVMNCSDEFNENCTKCNLCHLIATEQLPSLEIIFPEGQAIKKGQMEELKQKFSSIPYLSKYNTYIINDAEKFNASSANTMLKFIEEPEKNIVGFLITNNRENVISTIKSRCEIVKVFYEKENQKITEKIQKLSENYLYKIEVEKQQTIVYNKIVLDEKLEREEMIIFFKALFSIYYNLYQGKSIPEKLDKMKQISSPALIHRLQLVSGMLERLSYNVNINLLLDDFVLRLEEE